MKLKLWVRFLMLFVSTITFSLLSGCGGGGGGGTPTVGGGTPTVGGTVTNQQVELPELKLTAAAVNAPVLQNLVYGPYTGQDLKVLTLFGEAGTKTGTFVDANKGQLVFLETPDQQAVAVAYVPATDIAAGTTAISLDYIADGFIMSNPLMLGYESPDREALLNRAKSDPLYEELKSAIQNALDTEPQNLMNSSVFPQVYEYATKLILAAGAEVQAAQMARLAAATDPPSPVLGNGAGPYVGDFVGVEVGFVNPTMVFYGVDINNGSAFEVIPGKEKAWGVLWWTHGPVVEKYPLGDGQLSIRYTKGKIDGTTADSMAATANVIKTAQLIIDTLAWCPISNDSIAQVVESSFKTESGQEALISGYNDILAATPEKLLHEMVKFLQNKDNWRQVTKFIYAGAQDKDAAVRFLQNAKNLISAADAAFKVLEVYDAATSTVPFAWDLITKPSEISLCGSQAGGLLTPNCRALIPPVANAKVFSPARHSGDVVHLSIKEKAGRCPIKISVWVSLICTAADIAHS